MPSAKKSNPQTRAQGRARRPARPRRFWTRTRVGLASTALVVAAAFALAALATRESPQRRDLDPVFATELRSVGGESFRLSDYEGKVLVVNLWATWCGPCRAETPFFVALHGDYAARGVELVGLTTEDPARDAQKVSDFARQYGVPYRLGWAGRDFARELKRGVENIPQTFVYGRDGRLLARFTGYNSETSPTKIRAAVEQALAAEY